MIVIDGRLGEGGGQILRSALTLASVLGQPFEILGIRASRPRPGLRPQHLAAVRAAALCCQAKVSGAYEGSQELRYEPSQVTPGSYEFDIGTAGSAVLVLQTIIPILAQATETSDVRVIGGTHVPRSPAFHFFERAWLPEMSRLGYGVRASLRMAGFHPRGGGEVRARVAPKGRSKPYQASERGKLARVAGTSLAANIKGLVGERQAGAGRALLWERRRIESAWDVIAMDAASPGSYVQVQVEMEGGRGAFGALGTRGVRAEVLGERVARAALKFIDGEGALDAHLADQMVVPLALSGEEGRVTTPEVTAHLETVLSIARTFGVKAESWGRPGLSGGFTVHLS
jgi:RNA 3'-terminal phosphate cyclase (ATP)